MVVDIIGAPGAGKTTACNKIVLFLREKSIPYMDMTGRKDTPIWMKVFSRICLIWVEICPKYRKMYRDIISKLSPYPKSTEKFFHSDKDMIIKDVVRHVFAHKLFEHKKIYLLNDEGVLHKMIPLYIQHDVPVDLLLDIYDSFNLDLKLVYVENSMEQVVQNIKSRNRHDCACDEMDEQELHDYLFEYFSALNGVLNNETHTSVTDIYKELIITKK